MIYDKERFEHQLFQELRTTDELMEEVNAIDTRTKLIDKNQL